MILYMCSCFWFSRYVQVLAGGQYSIIAGKYRMSNGAFPETFGLEISEREIASLTEANAVALLKKHKLLLVRSLSLTTERLIEYGRKFGNLYLSSSDLRGNGEAMHAKTRHQEITVLSRTGLHGSAKVAWHIDLLHKPSDLLPGRVLYAAQAEIPSLTKWADTERAYELIDPASRMLADQSLCFYRAPYPTEWVGCMREMVLKKPGTHRRSLLVDHTFLQCIIGETYEDTEHWKVKVLSQILIPENIYIHNWRQGDLIIYDNNSTMHERETMASKAQGRRIIWRLTFD